MDEVLLEHALGFFRQHLELLKEKEESQLPRNGKSAATPADFSRESAFESKLQAIAAILRSSNESPEQSTTNIKEITPTHPTPQIISKPKTQDAFDTEPYINPLTGQWIFPVTPFTPGPSNTELSSKESIAAGIEKSKAIINDSSSYRAASATILQPPSQHLDGGAE